MNRERMFPTKSRLQVAICLEKLTDAASLAGLCAYGYASRKAEARADLCAMISHLCLSRTINLIRPCLYPSQAQYYNHRARLKNAEIRAFVAAVRGWRRRWPNLLQNPEKEN
jgi:hypothetical protein